MKLLQGKKIANAILAGVRLKIKKQKLKPRLAVILVGENKASKLYVKIKAQAARKVGIELVLCKFKSGAKERDVIKLIKTFNKDKKVNGIIVQLPLPEKFNTQKVINAINPKKDADGFGPENVREFLRNKKSVNPVFPTAIVKLLESAKTDLKHKKAVIIANSEIFGKVMKSALARKKIKSQILLRLNLHNLETADVIITAVGKPKMIKGETIRKGAIVIDGGITKRGKKVWGDVDFDSVAPVAGYLSPVPGGVGPVTVACLLENVYQLALKKDR